MSREPNEPTTPTSAQLAAMLVAEAVARGAHIAVAESLTGGLLTAQLVEVPGTSQVLTGGVIAYDTRLKYRMLGVSIDVLADHGPVDPEVARQMARGVRLACAVDHPADWGIATTGVAGPEPDPQTGQPVGTVWIAVSGVKGERAVLLADELGGEDSAEFQAVIRGGRDAIRAATVRAALDLALREMRGE